MADDDESQVELSLVMLGGKVTDEDGNERDFELQSKFFCNFCNALMLIGIIDGQYPALIHARPKCQTFTDLDINDFLEAHNKRGRQLGQKN